MGYLLFLIIIPAAYLGTLVASVAVAINAFQRWGRVRGVWGLLCPLGVLMFAAITDALGPTPRMGGEAQFDRLVEMGTSAAMALLGVALAVVGWIKTHPRQFPAGCCQKCGYELKDLPRCPECGADRPAATSGDAEFAGDGTTIPSAPARQESPASNRDATR